MRRMRFLVAALAAFAMTALVAAPASAQPEQQRGLVNVSINDVEVAVPVAVAANICDVNVNVIARQIRTGETVCEATAESGATFGPGNGNGNGQQRGLVNVSVSDVTILVPVSVAANLCDINVNVLAQQRDRGQTECTAVAESEA